MEYADETVFIFARVMVQITQFVLIKWCGVYSNQIIIKDSFGMCSAFRTNTGKQMFSYQAIDLWRDIPYSLKDLSTFSFAKEIKHYLLSEQYSKKFE